MSSTSHSSSLLMISGGGLVKLGPWISVSRNGVSKVAWNTLWIFHCRGNSSRYVRGPKTSMILKGPSLLGVNFFGRFNLRFFVSSHTCSCNLKGVNLLFILSAIFLLASSCAASASSLAFVSSLSLSAAAGTFDLA